MRDWDYYNYDGVARQRLTDYLSHDEQPGDFLTALISPLRELEQVYHLMLNSLSISAATGAGLDAFGELVNLPRLGLDDDTYRQDIINRRFSGGGSGTSDDIKRVIRGLIGTQGGVVLVNHRPAMYVAYADYSKASPLNLTHNVEAQSVAGVKPYIVQRVNDQGFKLGAVPTKAVTNILRVTPMSGNNAMRVTPLAQNNALKVNSRIISTTGSRLGSILGEPVSANANYRTTRFSGAVPQ